MLPVCPAGSRFLRYGIFYLTISRIPFPVRPSRDRRETIIKTQTSLKTKLKWRLCNQGHYNNIKQLIFIRLLAQYEILKEQIKLVRPLRAARNGLTNIKENFDQQL